MNMIEIPVPYSIWDVECHDAEGNLKWREQFRNLVFTAAVNDVLAVYFKGAAAKPNWYIGLLNSNASISANDTAQSHPGWTENTNYNASTRQPLTLGTIADKQVNNALAKAVFTMVGAAGSIVGAFLISDNVKGGAAGMLYAAAPFPSGIKNMAATDTLTISVMLSGA